jgi:uncharacterized protein
MGRVIVAFSGGTDSAYLAWAANRALGPTPSPSPPTRPRFPNRTSATPRPSWNASASCTSTSATTEFDNPDYARNDPDRCFHCKDELFTRLEALGRERGYEHIVYGVNVDDLGDYRPGQGAAKQHQVAAPLADAGLTKAEIRELSRLAGLPTWDRPPRPA